MATLEKEIYRHAGEEFNIGSPPQLAVILYEKLRLPILKRTQKGRAPSTDADVLEKLRDHHPIVDALLNYRELSKLKSTYLDALPPLVDPKTGRIHTTYNQVGAATGRLSSVNPNLQNIPVRGEIGRQVRRAFVPGAPDRSLLVADYSQIELRVMAHLSGDRAMAQAFAEGKDFHAATASKVFGLPEDQVDGAMRSRVKQINYGLPYGMSAYGLATRIGIAPDEAAEFVEAYFAQFPKSPGVPRPPGGQGGRRGVHRDHARPAPLPPGAPIAEPAGSGHGPADGPERPHPGRRSRHPEAGHDQGGRRTPRVRPGLHHGPDGP